MLANKAFAAFYKLGSDFGLAVYPSENLDADAGASTVARRAPSDIRVSSH
ncbi:MAG: hypothetical protein AB7U95_26610 [Reyranella sp.]